MTTNLSFCSKMDMKDFRKFSMRSITRRAFFLRIFKQIMSSRYFYFCWLRFNGSLKHIFQLLKSLNSLQRTLGSLLLCTSTTGEIFTVCFQGEDSEGFVTCINSPRDPLQSFTSFRRGRYHRGDFRVRGEYLWAISICSTVARRISFRTKRGERFDGADKCGSPRIR